MKKIFAILAVAAGLLTAVACDDAETQNRTFEGTSLKNTEWKASLSQEWNENDTTLMEVISEATLHFMTDAEGYLSYETIMKTNGRVISDEAQTLQLTYTFDGTQGEMTMNGDTDPFEISTNRKELIVARGTYRETRYIYQ